MTKQNINKIKPKNEEKYLEGLFTSIIEQYFKNNSVTTNGLIDFFTHGVHNEIWYGMDNIVRDVITQRILTKLSRKRILKSTRIKNISFYSMRNQNESLSNNRPSVVENIL